MKILIGYDGSPAAKRALLDLDRAGIQNLARVRMYSAVAPTVTRDAETAAAALRKRHPGWEVKVETGRGPAAQAILACSDRWKPDLIVVGSRGWSVLGKLLLGSVAEKVLAHANSSVRIGKSGPKRKHATLRLLIGFDGSPHSRAAMDRVAGRSWPQGTEVRIVTALDADAGMSRHAKRIRSLAEKFADRLVERGLDASYATFPGDARKVLLDQADAFRCDCIFLGSRGNSGISRFLLGSVSSAVAAHSPCTVEVVRRRQRGKI